MQDLAWRFKEFFAWRFVHKISFRVRFTQIRAFFSFIDGFGCIARIRRQSFNESANKLILIMRFELILFVENRTHLILLLSELN